MNVIREQYTIINNIIAHKACRNNEYRHLLTFQQEACPLYNVLYNVLYILYCILSVLYPNHSTSCPAQYFVLS